MDGSTHHRRGLSPERRMRHRRHALAMAVAAGLVLVVSACAPPGVGVTSPFLGTGGQVLDGHWEGNFVACTAGGGPVSVTIRGPWGFDTVNPYRVEVFDSWDKDPAHLVQSGQISEVGQEVTTAALAPGTCFAVRVTHPTTNFGFVVNWCSQGCGVVPAPPAVAAFETTGGPFSAPALVPFSWHVVDPNFDPLTCRLDGDGDGIWDLTLTDCPKVGARNLTVGAGDHAAVLEVDDGSHPPVRATTAVPVADGPAEPYNIEMDLSPGIDPALAPAVASAATGAVARWEAVIARGVPDQHVSSDQCGTDWPAFDADVDDVAIRLSVIPLDGRGGVVGTAGPCIGTPVGFPPLGIIYLDSADVPFIGPQLLNDLIAHEIGHIVLTDDWFPFIQGGDTDDPRFVGPRTLIEWHQLGGESTVPIQPHDLVHWRNADLGSELIATGHGALSAVTVAALADVGYHVNIAAAEPYTLPNTG